MRVCEKWKIKCNAPVIGRDSVPKITRSDVPIEDFREVQTMGYTIGLSSSKKPVIRYLRTPNPPGGWGVLPKP